MGISKTRLERHVIDAWNQAAQSLDITVVAPFAFADAEPAIECIAFLPEFGGPTGMVIGGIVPPAFDTDAALIRQANHAAVFFSFINLESYAQFNAPVFKEALKDWGFFGSPATRPAWLADD
jgi:hypothetical protein